MKIPPRLVIIGPEPGVRRTYNLIGFPIVIGSSDETNITIQNCGLADQHILIDKIDDLRYRIRRIGKSKLIHKRLNINDKIIDDRDIFVAESVGLQFFLPQFDVDESDNLVLEYLTGVNTGKKIQLEKTLTVGRRDTNNICLPVKKVSGFHGKFRKNDDTTYTDLSSRNGSRINGKKINPDTPVVIQVGDIIDIASHALYLQPASYNRKKVDDKLFLYLSEATEKKPTYGEYSPISEYSQFGQENPNQILSEEEVQIKPEDENVLLEISSNPKHKILENVKAPDKVTHFELEEMSNSDSISESFDDIQDTLKDSARKAIGSESEDEDMLFLGPDEDYDADNFDKMMKDIQQESKRKVLQTEKMPQPEEESSDVNKSEDKDNKKLRDRNILSDTYFDKIRRIKKDDSQDKKDEKQN